MAKENTKDTFDEDWFVDAEGMMDWDDVFDAVDEPEYILLKPGIYDYEVTGMERFEYEPKPGGKLPKCHAVKITFRVDTDQGSAILFDRLYLCKQMISKATGFFKSCGLAAKDAEIITPKWDEVVGATGKFRVKVEPYNGNDQNQVARYVVDMEG